MMMMMMMMMMMVVVVVEGDVGECDDLNGLAPCLLPFLSPSAGL